MPQGLVAVTAVGPSVEFQEVLMLKRREWHLKECSLCWLGTVGPVGASPLRDL